MAILEQRLLEFNGCTVFVTVDTNKGDGAIRSMRVITTSQPVTVWAIFRGSRVEQVFPPNTNTIRTFAGASAQANDLQAIGAF
jgi:hypothetical protein